MKEIIYLSDIHGNYEALKHLDELPEMQDDNVEIQFSGDYIDGFDLKPNAIINTIRYIKNLCESGKAKAIIGNHDEFIIDAAYNPYKMTFWSNNGKANTLDNLGLSDVGELREQLLYHYYDEMEWLRSLPLTIETGKNILVHAGLALVKGLHQQDKDTLLWIRDLYIYPEWFQREEVHEDYKGKTIITGHTPTINLVKGLDYCPIVRKTSYVNRYFIDGGSKGGPGFTGRINLLKLDENGNMIWQKYMTAEGVFDYQ